MRATVLTLFALLVGSAASYAQEPRFAVVITHGRSATTAIYDRAIDITEGPSWLLPSREYTRLSVDDGAMTSLRVAYRLAGAWRVSGEVARGAATYDYIERSENIDNPALASSLQARGPARRSLYSFAISRRSRVLGTPAFVEPEVGVTVHGLRVGRGLPLCPVVPPSAGAPQPGGDWCAFSREQWERTYTAPSVATGLVLGFPLTRWSNVQLRGQYSVGRLSTREGFWVDLIPELDYAEAPKSRQISSLWLSAGISLAP
jgi:hypothetical protein